MGVPIPETIVVATDYSEPATAATLEAVALATAADAEIVLVHAQTFGVTAGEERRRARRELEKYSARLVPSRLHHLLDLVEKPPVQAIVDAAESCDAGIVFVGTHGGAEATGRTLGSVSSGVIRSCERPVLTVPRQSDGRMRTVLCAIDFSDDSRAALDQALMLTRLLRARLTILHVVVPGSATEDYAANALDAWLPQPEANDPLVSCAVLRGEPEVVITDLGRSGDYDLIVLGSRGPLALSLARNAQCRVLSAHAVAVREPA